MTHNNSTGTCTLYNDDFITRNREKTQRNALKISQNDKHALVYELVHLKRLEMKLNMKEDTVTMFGREEKLKTTSNVREDRDRNIMMKHSWLRLDKTQVPRRKRYKRMILKSKDLI